MNTSAVQSPSKCISAQFTISAQASCTAHPETKSKSTRKKVFTTRNASRVEQQRLVQCSDMPSTVGAQRSHILVATAPSRNISPLCTHTSSQYCFIFATELTIHVYYTHNHYAYYSTQPTHPARHATMCRSAASDPSRRTFSHRRPNHNRNETCHEITPSPVTNAYHSSTHAIHVNKSVDYRRLPSSLPLLTESAKNLLTSSKSGLHRSKRSCPLLTISPLSSSLILRCSTWFWW